VEALAQSILTPAGAPPAGVGDIGVDVGVLHPPAVRPAPQLLGAEGCSCRGTRHTSHSPFGGQGMNLGLQVSGIPMPRPNAGKPQVCPGSTAAHWPPCGQYTARLCSLVWNPPNLHSTVFVFPTGCLQPGVEAVTGPGPRHKSRAACRCHAH